MLHVDVPQLELLKRKIGLTSSEDADGVSGNYDPSMLDVSRHINEELDLEVAIRERLVDTVEGRIQWALQMLDALSTTKEPQDQPFDADDFQEAALDALEAFESPSAFLFDTGFYDEPGPSSSHTSVAPPCQRAPKTRSSRTPKPSHQKKHLYIKLPSSAGDTQLAILVCPVCSRTQFTTLQGLLNHARLAHGVEWASHDVCITACAIPVSVDAESEETYERDGVEVPWGGNVVGLRRLFERAVGMDEALPTALDASLDGSVTTPSTLLSRTLGLHADTPALAQFLGRAPKRRCIHVYDQDQHVDITTLDVPGAQANTQVLQGDKPRRGFSMRYPHRNTARKDLDIVVDIDSGAEATGVDGATPVIIPASATTSRFYITARVRLEDRSLFLKEERRVQLGVTDQYRWMLGVTAPSYSLPLSSFLSCVTVVPPRSVSPVFLTVQQQPFAIIGTANEPFMAKIIFEWVDGGKMEVEHWVELDQSRSYSSVFGSEQLFDVELDRNIPLLTVPKGNTPPLPSLDRQLPQPPHGTPQTDASHGKFPTTKEEYYEQVLRDLLPKVPMTAKDVKPRTALQVPYKLVSSPAHLLGLIPGRRKAIEWARARALHALYVERTAMLSPSQRTRLTVGDVYMFLEDGSHFPRSSRPTYTQPLDPKKKRREKDETPALGEEFCPICGIKKRLHRGFDVKSEENPTNWTCTTVQALEQRYGERFPLVDLSRVLAWPNGLQSVVRDPLPTTTLVPNRTMKSAMSPWQHPPRDVLVISPPELILAVNNVVSKLRLPAFLSYASEGRNFAFLTNREDTEQCLAPAALLSIALRPFISTLLRSAIEIAKQDVTAVAPGGKDGRRTKKLSFILTPSHILRGLRLQSANNLRTVSNLGRSSDPQARELTALSLAHFGVDVELGPGKAMDDVESEATVKAEPE